MGMFSDLLASAKSIDTSTAITAGDRTARREIDEQIDRGDAQLPSGAAFQADDEVQTLAASGASAGTFDITVGIKTDIGDFQIAVTSIAYNAMPTTIETALDSAANGTIPGWTDGDISVSSAGTAELSDVVFTYDGASVASLQHPLSTVDGSGLTGGGSEAFAETNAGSTARNLWGIFEQYSLVDFGGTPPTQGGSLPTLTAIQQESRIFSAATLRAFALEAEIEDGIAGLEAALLEAFNLKSEPSASSQG